MSEYDSKKECSAKGPVRARFAGSERESLQITPSHCARYSGGPYGHSFSAASSLRSAAGPNDARSVGAREKRLAHSRMVPRHDNLGQVTQELNPLPGSPEDPAIIATNGKGIPYLRARGATGWTERHAGRLPTCEARAFSRSTTRCSSRQIGTGGPQTGTGGGKGDDCG